MRASASSKPKTDAYGAIAVSSLYAVPLAQVQVLNPTADLDPNTAGLLPTNPRVLAFPNYAQRQNAQLAASVLGGASLVGRVWCYDTASGKWLAIGNLLTITVTGTSGTTSVSTLIRSKRAYWQTTSVVGAVTELTYGFSN